MNEICVHLRYILRYMCHLTVSVLKPHKVIFCCPAGNGPELMMPSMQENTVKVLLIWNACWSGILISLVPEVEMSEAVGSNCEGFQNTGNMYKMLC